MPQRLPNFFLRLRFATAVFATWIMNLGMFGERFKTRAICTPGFNCHGCPWASATCPIGAIAYGSVIHAIPIYAIASILAVGAVAGRLVCSFACPAGLVQDLLHRVPSPKFRLPRFFRYGKYLTLALLVIALPWALGFKQGGYLLLSKPGVDKNVDGNIVVKITASNLGAEPVRGVQVIAAYRSTADGSELLREARDFPDVTIAPGERDVALPWFEMPNHLDVANMEVSSPQSEITQTSPHQLYYCVLCPTATLSATIPAWAGSDRPLSDFLRVSWLRLSILAMFILLAILFSRPLCRIFCPLGAIYALTAPWSITSMRIESTACTDCGRCDKVCPMELDVRTEIGGRECIVCGDCKKACSAHGISRTFGLAPATSHESAGEGIRATVR